MDHTLTLKKIKDLTEIANRDPVDYPLTWAGIAAAARQAQDEIVVLKSEYENSLATDGIPIFVSGPAAAEYQKIAVEEFGSIPVDANELYKRISEEPYKSLGHTHEFNAHQNGLVLTNLRYIAGELKINELYAPKHEILPVVVHSPAELESYLRAVVDAANPGLNGVYCLRKAVNYGLANDVTNTTVPIIVTNYSLHDTKNNLFKRTPEFVTATGDINKTTITKSFTEIKQKLKKGK